MVPANDDRPFYRAESRTFDPGLEECCSLKRPIRSGEIIRRRIICLMIILYDTMYVQRDERQSRNLKISTTILIDSEQKKEQCFV